MNLVAGLPSDRHTVGQIEDVAAGREAADVRGERRERLQQLAAQHEHQIGVRALAKHRADVHERLQRSAEPPPGVLGGLGDPGDLAMPLREEGHDQVELTVLTGAEYVGGAGDFDRH